MPLKPKVIWSENCTCFPDKCCRLFVTKVLVFYCQFLPLLTYNQTDGCHKTLTYWEWYLVNFGNFFVSFWEKTWISGRFQNWELENSFSQKKKRKQILVLHVYCGTERYLHTSGMSKALFCKKISYLNSLVMFKQKNSYAWIPLIIFP